MLLCRNPFLALQKRVHEIKARPSLLRPSALSCMLMQFIFLKLRHAKLGLALTRCYRRWITLTIWLAAFLSNVLMRLDPTVMMQRGELFAASFGFGALMQIMSFIGGLARGDSIVHRIVFQPLDPGLLVGTRGNLRCRWSFSTCMSCTAAGGIFHHWGTICAEQLRRGVLRDKLSSDGSWS